jgi:anti-anti-sigma factor
MKEIKNEKIQDVTVLKLNGHFTGGDETDELIKQMKETAASSDNKLIVDFSRVYFISSIVIGMLVKMYTEFNEKNGKVVYSGFNQTLENVLKMTKVWSFLNIEEDLNAALKSFGIEPEEETENQ